MNIVLEYAVLLADRYADCRKRIMKEFSLTAAEIDILLFLANNPDLDTAALISDIRKIPKSQVSLSVGTLCAKGLLDKAHAAGNKKSVHLTPTEAAKPVIEAGQAMQRDFGTLLFSGFSAEEKQTFLSLCKKIEHNLQTEGRA